MPPSIASPADPQLPPVTDPPRVRSRTFGSLIDSPEYRRFFTGQGISLIGTWMQNAAVLWLVTEMTGSPWWAGVIEASGILPGLFVGLVGGALADRVEPRRMVQTTLVAQMLLTVVLAYLVAVGQVRIWHMGVILALTRVCVGFEMPSRQVLLYEVVGRESLMNAIALNSGLFNASRVVGPAMAGQLLATVGAAACFGLNALSYLAAIVAVWTIRPRPRPEVPEGGRQGLSAILDGLGYLRRDRRVGRFYALMAFFGIIGMGYSALLPTYARQILHTNEVGYSALLSSAGLGATVGALLVASLGGLRRKEHLVLGGMAVFGLALGAAGLLPILVDRHGPAWAVLPVASACLFVIGFGGLLFYSSTQTLIQTAVPDHLRGRIAGIWMLVFSSSMPLGSLWAGWAAHRFGVAPTLRFAAVVCVTTALLVLFSGGLAEKSPAASHKGGPLTDESL